MRNLHEHQARDQAGSGETLVKAVLVQRDTLHSQMLTLHDSFRSLRSVRRCSPSAIDRQIAVM